MTKRFCLFFNQIPGRMRHIPFLMEEFELIPFRPDVSDLNDYEAIYIYTIPGGNKSLYEKYCRWNEFAKYLREHGVTRPKILWQADYYWFPPHDWRINDVIPYVDAILVEGEKHFDLPVPVFYVQYPALPWWKKKKWWIDFDDKENAAVTVKRHYGAPEGSLELARRVGIQLHILGTRLKPPTYVGSRRGEEYAEYLACHKLGFDFHNNYYGWSRFVYECAYAGTPVLAPPDRMGARIANPDLVGKWQELVEKAKRLLTDKEYYEECRIKALKNIEEHLSAEACAERYKYALRQIGIDI